MLNRFKSYGMTRVSSKYFAGARHELLNETNRDEVQKDAAAWLGSLQAGRP